MMSSSVDNRLDRLKELLEEAIKVLGPLTTKKPESKQPAATKKPAKRKAGANPTLTASKATKKQKVAKAVVAHDQRPFPDGKFVTEAITDHDFRDGKLVLRIKWLNFPESENTWEPVDNLLRTNPLLIAYVKKWSLKF
jgi:hypothetical protein